MDSYVERKKKRKTKVKGKLNSTKKKKKRKAGVGKFLGCCATASTGRFIDMLLAVYAMYVVMYYPP